METINEGVVVGGEESAAGHALYQLSQYGTGNGSPIVCGRTSTCRGGRVAGHERDSEGDSLHADC